MDSFKTPNGTTLPLKRITGKDYLEVKYRLVWFREEKPDWGIETEFLGGDATSALAKATVRDSSGRIVATGHKFEDVQGFADFREKAETGAVGRALALIGYGTQFAEELEEGDRIVDSPVAPKPLAQGAASPTRPQIQARGPHDPAICEHTWAASLYKNEDYCTRRCGAKRPREGVA